MTINQLVERFVQNPSYLNTGAPKLAKQFNVSVEDIYSAKQLIKEENKKQIEERIRNIESISLHDFAKSIGIDMDNDPDMDIPKEESNDCEDFDSEEWIQKAKWIKTSNQSTLLVRKSKDTNNDINELKQAFRELIDEYDPESKLDSIINKVNELYTVNSNALFVYMSDKHIGAETKENSLFENDWNKEEFSNRMTKLAVEIIRLNEIYHFEQIFLFDLGDAIDGFNKQTTRGGHILPQNMSNREVYKTFIDVHLDFLYTLSQYIMCNMTYITVGESNHGGDFEWICNKSLEQIISLKFTNIDMFVGDKFIEHFLIGDHCFIICHGKDAEDLKFPLPKNLNEKTELYFKKYIDAHNLQAKYIHVIKGDLHCASSEYGEFFRYKNVSSMYGSSKWVQTNFMTNTKGVSMDILSGNTITEHQLFLSKDL